MKLRIGLIAFTLIVGVSVWAIVRIRTESAQAIALAYTYGKLQSFLECSNYAAAYQLMSEPYRKQCTLEQFPMNSIKNIFQGHRFDSDAQINISGNSGRLFMKYSGSFGTEFYFVREKGEWCFTGEMVGIEKLDWALRP
jgi:hypothetical protein